MKTKFLQYSLQNLTADNFNAAALQNLSDAQKNEVANQLQKVYTLLNQMSTEIDSLSGRVSGTENLSGRVTTAESKIDDLEEWTDAAERQIGDLQRRVDTAEEATGDLAGRVKQLEDDQTLEQLQEAVMGEGGLQEQVRTAQQDLRQISGIVQVAEDGSIIVGAEGKTMNLVGQIYINGVLIEQGGTE